MVSSIPAEPWNNLEGKVVMVTGASSGLGREFCIDLAKAGCKVVAAARRKDRLKSLCNQINQQQYCFNAATQIETETDKSVPSSIITTTDLKAISIDLDVTSDGETIKLGVQRAWDAFGHIDALVNNAGIRGEIRSSLELSESEWRDVVNTNLTGAWLVSKYIGLCMKEAGQPGSIINISSISGLNRGQFCQGVAYSSSKAAMDSMTKVMALELGMLKIRVNSIAPGIFKSEITEGLYKKEWLKNVEKRSVPLETFGTSDPALTSLVRFLIHESSRYITGNIFIADAGYTLPGCPIFSSL